MAQHRYQFQNKMPVLAFILLLIMLGFHYIKHCLPFFPCFFYRRLADKPETTTTANCHGGCHKAHLKVDAGHRLVYVLLRIIHREINPTVSFCLRCFCSVKPGEVFSVISAAEGNSRFIKLLCEFRAVKFQTDVQTKQIYFVSCEAVQSIQQQLIHI